MLRKIFQKLKLHKSRVCKCPVRSKKTHYVRMDALLFHVVLTGGYNVLHNVYSIFFLDFILHIY